MHFVIRKLILWPVDPQFSPRELTFVPDKINLITGRSGTGKSAILAISDYVLGSGKCAIPVGPIRTTVSWYGLLIDLDDTQVLVARRQPGSQLSSTEYYLKFGTEIEIPEQPNKTTNLGAFKDQMDRRSGLPNIDFDPGQSKNGFLARPSFRDMAAFNYLPQYLVANPSVLFFKSDTTEHRQKLTTIFPFVLGAVSAKNLVDEHELAELLREKRRLSVELKQREHAAELWRSEAYGLYDRAVELGLIDSEGQKPSTSEGCLEQLNSIQVRMEQSVPLVSTGATERAAIHLQELRDKENTVASKMSRLRARIARIEDLRQSVVGLDVAVNLGMGRVSGIGWFRKNVKGNGSCSMCGATHNQAQEQLEKLSVAADELMEQQRAVRAIPANLEREHKELSLETRLVESELSAIRMHRAELENVRESNGGQSLEQVYRFAGRVEQSINNLSATSVDGELTEKLGATQRRIAELQKTLASNEKRRRLDAALQLVNSHISGYAGFLSLERAKDAIRLLPKDLTLIFENPDSRRADYLWELGSGANWMGYHISTMLALHDRFLEMESSYVPSFLMIDQPSQVYFPSGVPSDTAQDAPDILATQRVFEALQKSLLLDPGRFQVIVVEHADDRTLHGIEAIHKVADWHQDNVDWLIPSEWISR